jgi:hypothetical protein
MRIRGGERAQARLHVRKIADREMRDEQDAVGAREQFGRNQLGGRCLDHDPFHAATVIGL